MKRLMICLGCLLWASLAGAAGDFNKPTVDSTRLNYAAEIRANFGELAKQLDGSTAINLPTGAKRWNSSGYKWETWSGAAWGDLATTYGINVHTVDGYHASQAPVAGQIPVLDSTGKLVIPSARLTDGERIDWNGTGAFVTGYSSSGILLLGTNNTERMRIAASGNTLVGTTNEGTWAANYRAIRISNYLSLANQTDGSGGVSLNWNAIGKAGNGVFGYLNSGDIASQIYTDTGGFRFRQAPIGTAGNTITWDASRQFGMETNGNFLIGTATDNGTDKLQVNGNITATGNLSGALAATNLTGTISSDRFPAGTVIGYAETKISGVFGVTGAIPYDDSIPQNNEGTEVFTLSYTPKRANSLLRIEFFGTGEWSGGTILISALFVDSTANALAAEVASMGTDNWQAVAKLDHTVTSGSTNARTYKIRCGANTGTFYLNGQAGNQRMFGGVGYTRMSVTEIAQ